MFAERCSILKFGEKMLGTFGLWALTQPFFDVDAKNREAEPGVAFWNGGLILEPTKKGLSAIRQDPCQADACREAETVIQVLDRLFSIEELEDDLYDLLWQSVLFFPTEISQFEMQTVAAVTIIFEIYSEMQNLNVALSTNTDRPTIKKRKCSVDSFSQTSHAMLLCEMYTSMQIQLAQRRAIHCAHVEEEHFAAVR